jgi:hypothetical protein
MADFNLGSGYEVPIGTAVQQISTTAMSPTTLTNVAVNDTTIFNQVVSRINSVYTPVTWSLELTSGSSTETFPPKNRPNEGQLYPRFNK